MRIVFMVGFVTLFTLGCGNDGDLPEVTRADADQAKADGDVSWICERFGAPSDCDICEVLGWYDDGICDDVCDTPDMDCACGGFAGLTCADDEFCNYPEDQGCGFADGMGACQRRPGDCMYAAPDPVCGCDGETYVSSCNANANGVSVAYQGVCESTCPDPDDPTVRYMSQNPEECRIILFQCEEGEEGFTNECGCGCVDLEPTICGGFLGSICDADEYCEFSEEANCGIADMSGVCRPRPGDCMYAAMDPVCGCDGVTYPSDCNANANGVDFRSRGACGGEETICGGFLGSICADDEYCDFDEEANCGITDASGVCRPRPGDCVYAAMDPVCGCDGVTYPSDCNANANGVDFRSRGTCEGEETICGGFLGSICADDQYCDYEEEANCGIADASGICLPRPGDCMYAAMDPVCGCDGETYPSDCNAHANGVDFRSRGMCE